MKRAYQIGEREEVKCEEIAKFLNDKDFLVEYNEDFFYKTYKDFAQLVRDQLNINYYVSLGRLIPKENADEEIIEYTKNHIVILIFDLELSENTKDFYEAKFDEEKGLYYIEY